MQQIQLNPAQQRDFARKMNDELDKVIMSWDNEVKEWYPIAIRALSFASCLTLNIPQKMFSELLKTETQGLNMNVVMILCNNVEARTPAEMGVSVNDWAGILLLNYRIAQQWMNLKGPVEKRVKKEFEIMLNKPKLVIAEA